jgi:hypothetical protein
VVVHVAVRRVIVRVVLLGMCVRHASHLSQRGRMSMAELPFPFNLTSW